MSDSIRVGVICGSLRKGSWNKKLARRLAKHLETEHGFTIDEIDLAQLDLPMFSEDLEAEAFPESAVELKKRMIACDALLFASPEYNGSLSGALKNAIDWASRPREGEAVLACFMGKPTGIVAASPGALGGLRGLRELRTILSGIKALVVPTDFALAKAHEAFDDNGELTDERARSMALSVGDELARITKALSSN